MKSSSVISLFDDPGFFGGAVIGDEEAPPYLVGSRQPIYEYYAVLKKDSGFVSWVDFLKYARRLTVLSYRVYKRAEWELTADSRGPISFYISSTGNTQKPPYYPNDVSQLNMKVFQAIFKCAYAMELRINHRAPGRPSLYFSRISWHSEKPDTLFVSAEREGQDDRRGTALQLEQLLYRKMFYVPRVAPGDKFSVEVGFEVYNDESMELPE